MAAFSRRLRLLVLVVTVLAAMFSGAASDEDLMEQTAKLEMDYIPSNGDCGVTVAASDDSIIVAVDAPDGTSTTAANSFKVWKRGSLAGDWNLEDTITLSSLRASDRFGSSVSLDGDTAIVAAAGTSVAGGVFVFERQSGGSWSQTDFFEPDDGESGDEFGYSVSLSGQVAVVGAPSKGSYKGCAYAFGYNGSTWVQEAILTHEHLDVNDFFGYQVDIHGEYAIVGAPYHNERRGAAFLFLRTDGVWTFEAKLWAAGSTNDQFGTSVAIHGWSIAVGALGMELSAGAAYVFGLQFNPPVNASTHYIQGVNTYWWQEAELTIDLVIAQTLVGAAVDLNDDYVLIGAPGTTDDTTDAARTGVAYFYTRNNEGGWRRSAMLSPTDGTQEMRFGHTVALMGATSVIGACRYQGNRHSSYVFDVVDCTLWECGTGWVKINPIASCAATFCTQEECCEAADTCEEGDCSSGYTLILPTPDYCPSAVCTQDDCCEALGTCHEGNCLEGQVLKDAAELPSSCTGFVCTDSQCCNNLGRCSSDLCTTGMIYLASPPSYCANLTCTAVECCENAGTCSSDICPSTHYLLDNLPTYCESATCTIAECCQAYDLCRSSVCTTEGYALSVSVGKVCSTATCAESECCHVLGQCSDYSCPDYYAKKSETDDYCSRFSCVRDECCSYVFGDCSNFICSASLVLKSDLPTSCVSNACVEEECCGTPGLCSVSDCSEGWEYLDLIDGNCSRTKCTQAECCVRGTTEAEEVFVMPTWLIIVGAICLGVSTLLAMLLTYLCCRLSKAKQRAKARKVRPRDPEVEEAAAAYSGPRAAAAGNGNWGQGTID